MILDHGLPRSPQSRAPGSGSSHHRDRVSPFLLMLGIHLAYGASGFLLWRWWRVAPSPSPEISPGSVCVHPALLLERSGLPRNSEWEFRRLNIQLLLGSRENGLPHFPLCRGSDGHLSSIRTILETSSRLPRTTFPEGFQYADDGHRKA